MALHTKKSSKCSIYWSASTKI